MESINSLAFLACSACKLRVLMVNIKLPGRESEVKTMGNLMCVELVLKKIWANSVYCNS